MFDAKNYAKSAIRNSFSRMAFVTSLFRKFSYSNYCILNYKIFCVKNTKHDWIIILFV